MQAPLRSSTRHQRGYALILVMVALVTLTILGVTSLTASQLDMQITQNMRHHKALQYGALTGQDHARDLAEDASFDGFDTYNTAFATAAHCTSQFIGAAVDSPSARHDPSFSIFNFRIISESQVEVRL